MLSPPDVVATMRRHRFEELYAAHRVSVLGYALRRTDNTDDAADVLAETFLIAWRRMDEVPPGDQARLWLYGTARRILANHRRGERRRLALADRLRDELATSYRPPDLPPDVAEIAAAFRRLPQPDQELLALTAWEGAAGSPLRSRRVLIGVPVAATLAVAGLIVTSLGTPGQRIGPISLGPPKAQAAALSFTRHDGYIRVIVRNPLADPKKYRAEFARHHLDISLTLVPASPSVVGTLVEESQSVGSVELAPITAIGRCFTGGGGNVCPVGVKVPLDFHGSASLVFGRTARPDEQYESAGQANGPGEAMHGLSYQGKTVATVLAMLARRGVTVPQWRVQRAGQCYMEERRSVPADWLVYDAVPWAPGQVLLWAAKTLPVPACAPTPGSPVPSPAPTG